MHGAVIMKILPMFRSILWSLLHGPATIRYPAEPAKQTPVTRGQLVIAIEKCIFCGLCRMHCPAQAIEVKKPDLTWQLDRFRCVICGNCVEFCPTGCLAITQTYFKPTTGPVIERYQGVPKPVEQKETDNTGCIVD